MPLLVFSGQFICVCVSVSPGWCLRSRLLRGILKKLFPTGIGPIRPTGNYSSSPQPYQSPWVWSLFVSNLSIRAALLRSMPVEVPCSEGQQGWESWHVSPSHYLQDFWEYRPWIPALVSRAQHVNKNRLAWILLSWERELFRIAVGSGYLPLYINLACAPPQSWWSKVRLCVKRRKYFCSKYLPSHGVHSYWRQEGTYPLETQVYTWKMCKDSKKTQCIDD